MPRLASIIMLFVGLLLSSIIFSQIKQSKKNDTIIKKMSEPAVIKQTGLQDGEIKVIITKEKDNTDYVKYILPILTLVLGIAINKSLDYLTDRKKALKTGKRWVIEFTLLNSPIKQQIDALAEFATTLEKDVYDIPMLNTYPSLDGETFQNLDRSDLFRYIKIKTSSNEKTTASIANKAIGTITILSSNYKVLIEKFNEFLDRTSFNNTTLTEHLRQLLNAFKKYDLSLEKELNARPLTDPRYQPISKLFESYIYPHMGTGRFDVYLLRNLFFIPLLRELALLRNDERTIEMTDFCTACLNDIQSIKAEKGYMIHNSKTIIKRFENQLIEIQHVIDQISGTFKVI